MSFGVVSWKKCEVQATFFRVADEESAALDVTAFTVPKLIGGEILDSAAGVGGSLLPQPLAIDDALVIRTDGAVPLRQPINAVVVAIAGLVHLRDGRCYEGRKLRPVVVGENPLKRLESYGPHLCVSVLVACCLHHLLAPGRLGVNLSVIAASCYNETAGKMKNGASQIPVLSRKTQEANRSLGYLSDGWKNLFEPRDKTMKIDYDAVRLYHNIDAVYSDTETHRRLREVREYRRGTNSLIKGLQRTLSRKSDLMNDTEASTLRSFPIEGLDIGYYSATLIFGPSFNHMKKRTHIAIVSLIRLGWLGIVEGIDQDGNQKQVIVRVK